MSSEKLSDNICGLDVTESKEDSGLFINLKSDDGKVFKVSKENAIISDVVKVAIEGDGEATEIPLSGVKGDILEYIVEYMNKKKGDKTIVVCKPLKVSMEDSCSPSGKWEAEFINKVYETKHRLHDMVMASNYMAINSLLHLSCARVGLSLKGKSKDKMMEELDLQKPQ